MQELLVNLTPLAVAALLVYPVGFLALALGMRRIPRARATVEAEPSASTTVQPDPPKVSQAADDLPATEKPAQESATRSPTNERMSDRNESAEVPPEIERPTDAGQPSEFIAPALPEQGRPAEASETPIAAPGPRSKPRRARPKKRRPAQPAKKETDPLEELHALIGLSSVKEEVENLSAFALYRNAREGQGLPVPDISYHMVFTGNPGTGKTTVARIVGRLYKDLGLLKKGHMVEVNPRTDLIGGYVGHTAPKVEKVIKRAMDGVLFIDEAYTLVPADPERDLGPEAIATLLKHMEDSRDRLVVIAAGYKSEMDRFVSYNPGLKSRFATFIDFPDYSPSELMQIFDAFCEPYRDLLTPSARSKLTATLETLHARREEDFGNARLVRNIHEMAIKRRSRRLATNPSDSKDALVTFEEVDIPSSDDL